MEESKGLVFELAGKYRALRETKDKLEEELKGVSEAISNAERDLANEMVNGELQSIDFGGKLFYLYPEMRVSVRGGKQPEAFDWLRDHDLGDLIKETVNSNSLTSEVKKYLAEMDETPDLLKAERDVIEMFANIFERTRVGLRGR